MLHLPVEWIAKKPLPPQLNCINVTDSRSVPAKKKPFMQASVKFDYFHYNQ